MDIQITEQGGLHTVSYKEGGLTKEQAQALAARLLNGLLQVGQAAQEPVVTKATYNPWRTYVAMFHVGKNGHEQREIKARNSAEAYQKAKELVANIPECSGVRVYEDEATAQAAEKKRVWWVNHPKAVQAAQTKALAAKK